MEMSSEQAKRAATSLRIEITPSCLLGRIAISLFGNIQYGGLYIVNLIETISMQMVNLRLRKTT